VLITQINTQKTDNIQEEKNRTNAQFLLLKNSLALFCDEFFCCQLQKNSKTFEIINSSSD
jgi:hypothetical protein